MPVDCKVLALKTRKKAPPAHAPHQVVFDTQEMLLYYYSIYYSTCPSCGSLPQLRSNSVLIQSIWVSELIENQNSYGAHQMEASTCYTLGRSPP
jgi:hypothetical protein